MPKTKQNTINNCLLPRFCFCELSCGAGTSRRTSTVKTWVRVGCTTKIQSGVPAPRLAYLGGQQKEKHNSCSSLVSMMRLWLVLRRRKRQEDKNNKKFWLERQRQEKTFSCIVKKQCFFKKNSGDCGALLVKI